jgi:hypothetical protein
MPQDQTDSALMVQQINDRFRQGPDVLAYANDLINFNLRDFSIESNTWTSRDPEFARL